MPGSRSCAGRGKKVTPACRAALNYLFPAGAGYCLSLPREAEQLLMAEKIYAGEAALKEQWMDRIYNMLAAAGLEPAR